MRLVLVFSFLLCACGHAAPPAAVAVDTVPPRPEDVGSIDGMLKAFYEVVNVAPDEPRQWGRDRTLYTPDVRFVGVGRTGVTVYDHQKFVEDSEPLVKAGFFEREIRRTVWRYGNIAHVLSSYETRRTKDGPVEQRGVNSLDLYFDGARWWISHVAWQAETKELPLPKDFVAQP